MTHKAGAIFFVVFHSTYLTGIATLGIWTLSVQSWDGNWTNLMFTHWGYAFVTYAWVEKLVSFPKILTSHGEMESLDLVQSASI